MGAFILSRALRAAVTLFLAVAFAFVVLRLVAQRSGTLFGYPTDLLRSQGVDNSWVLIFNPGQEDEGVCAAARRPSEPVEPCQRRR